MSMQPISMEEAKKKLAGLEEFMPDSKDFTLLYDFGRFLAEYLNPKLVPIGFVMGCELALNDLQTGVNGFTRKPIRGSLIGYPPGIYALLRMEIPRIAKAVFPEDFAKEVKAVFDEINKKLTATR